MDNLRSGILSDPVAEARRLLDAAEDANLILRAMGGIGISLHTGLVSSPPFRRNYADLDFACSRKNQRLLSSFFTGQGYRPNLRLNGYMGQVRQMYLDPGSGRHVDVFIGRLDMCHTIPLEKRLRVNDGTLPLAELVLSKFQIVELNQKDILDVCAALVEHPVADHDHDAVNGARIAALCAADWGLWRTFTSNLDRVRQLLPSLGLSLEWERLAQTSIGSIKDRIDAQAKTPRWRFRSLVGERVRWYDLPEEQEKA